MIGEGRLGSEEAGGKPPRDLVVVTIRGVQRFIAEARSTADLHAGSALISGLSAAMVESVRGFGHDVGHDVDLIMPMPSPGGLRSMPNRVVAWVAAGHGRALAENMADAARRAWRECEPSVANGPGPGAAPTPGFPDVQWVVAGPADGGYERQWEQAAAALANRKRIRDFAFPPAGQVRICSLTGRWAALTALPERAWNVREDEGLSLVGHAKRKFSRDAGQRFPSTWSIASAPYRAAIIEAAERDEKLRGKVAELRGYITEFINSRASRDRARIDHRTGSTPGMPVSSDENLAWLGSVEGAWCVPAAWDPATLRASYELGDLPDAETCDLVRMAAGELATAAAAAGLTPLTPYLAVIAQDADHMGEALADFPPGLDAVTWHRNVSAALGKAARLQRDTIEAKGSFGRVVYAGGDDLLALTPAATALACVRRANAAFGQVLSAVLPEATASAAVVYFHAAWPLQSAIAAVQALLDEAKDAERPGLGVAVLRRGGERSRLILPWRDPGNPDSAMIDHVEALATSMAGAQAGLSGRLASELERDRAALGTLGPDWLKRELLRRNARHGGAEAGGALLALSPEDSSGRRGLPVEAVTVARFIAASVAAGAVTVPAAPQAEAAGEGSPS
ncbi:MAG TPA: type III-B CRISPR-associated protein Cas10/Cmr2 [Trebonia sp.]|nr:type III-B CRISPR-associated protein Cas10/Cmr2 [Trebonia sp.]